MSDMNTRNWVLYRNESQEQVEYLKSNAGELLLYTVQLLKELKLESLTTEYQEILLFSVTYIQFKNIIVD